MRKQRNYDAYKIFVLRRKLYLFLDDNLWPEEIAFRRYVDFKKRAEDSPKNITMDCDNNDRNSKASIFVSFNCESITRSVDYVRLLCQTSDIIALQKT